jgi:hypothetical protein
MAVVTTARAREREQQQAEQGEARHVR